MKWAPKKKKVLDVGCGSGLYGEALMKMGNKVYGMDSAVEVKKICDSRLTQFYLQDITDYKTIEKVLKGQTFDVIVFADVLEHLPDPVTTLTFYTQFLSKKGLIYISLPNVGVWYVRFAHLFGKFDYTETGVMDKTHLRFFTKKTIMRLLKECNLEAVTVDIVPGIFVGFAPLVRAYFTRGKDPTKLDKMAIVKSPSYKFYMRYIYPVEYAVCRVFPGLLGFKYIVRAKKI
jgi:SAM-dependent methyltransferase